MTAPSLPAPQSEALEHQRYRAHLALATLGTLVHGAMLAHELSHAPDALDVTLLGSAVAISAGLTVLVLARRVPLLLLTGAVAYGLPVWLLLAVLAVGALGRPLPQTYYLSVGVVTLLLFAWLPQRRAVGLAALVLLFMAGAVLRLAPQDVPLLLYTAFLVGLIAFLNLHGQLVSAERTHRLWLQQLAITDGLTGALNRRGGWEVLEAGTRDPGLAALLLDIDRFKQINDRLRHEAGDVVLVRVAQAAREAAGARGHVVRWGGEEFLVILPGVGRAEAQEVAGQIVQATRRIRLPGLDAVPVSLGLAFADEAPDLEALLDLADRRMYAAKRAGGDRWQ